MSVKVSFDYDGTLSRESIQVYAKDLISKGFEVWIVTARYDSPERYSEEFKTKYRITDINEEHKQLFTDAKWCGIPLNQIQFMNMADKAEFFAQNTDFLWHLDDDNYELKLINSQTKTMGISCVSGSNWKHKCERLIKKKLNGKI